MRVWVRDLPGNDARALSFIGVSIGPNSAPIDTLSPLPGARMHGSDAIFDGLRECKDVLGIAEAEDAVEFELYVAHHRRPLIRFAAMITADPRLAEDVVSDTLAKAFEKWESIGGLDNPHSYVRKMVLNDYLSWRRRARRTSVRAELGDLVEPEPDHAEATVTRLYLIGELKRLPPKQRAALVLRYIEGLSVPDIAAALGSGENAVRSNMSRGLAQLRVQLSNEVDRSLPITVVEAIQ